LGPDTAAKEVRAALPRDGCDGGTHVGCDGQALVFFCPLVLAGPACLSGQGSNRLELGHQDHNPQIFLTRVMDFVEPPGSGRFGAFPKVVRSRSHYFVISRGDQTRRALLFSSRGLFETNLDADPGSGFVWSVSTGQGDLRYYSEEPHGFIEEFSITTGNAYATGSLRVRGVEPRAGFWRRRAWVQGD
jgi:hypothetical protein